MASHSAPTLERRLGALAGTAIVVGSVIGTGVFLKTSSMAQLVGSPKWVLLAWVIAGLLSLMGALAYAELGVRFPQAGGEYIYLSEAFGPMVAFLFGWMRFWIATPASIAAYAVASATFLTGIWFPSHPATTAFISIALILCFSLINCMSVSVSGWTQTFLTVLKVLIILGLIMGAVLWGDVPITRLISTINESPTPDSTHWPGWAAMGAATLAALWAYDGWNSLPMMAGEMKNPTRTIPISLCLGMAIILILYVAANCGYFLTLPFAEITNANSSLYPNALPVATKSAIQFLGPISIKLLAVAMVLSAVGAMNGQILSGARVPYAMTHDKLFFKVCGEISPRTRVPVKSVWIQSLISCVYVFSGTFDQLTDSVVFASWIFYGGTTLALFKFRSQSTKKTTFRTPGYPVLPALFVILSALLVADALYTSFLQSLLGLILIGLGVPAYRYFCRTKT